MSEPTFDEVMEAFDREIIRNENGARDVLVEAGVLVPIERPRMLCLCGDWHPAHDENNDPIEGAKPARPRWPSGPDAERELAAALHDANVDCDYSRRFDRKSCQAGDGPHSIMAHALLAALQEKRDPGE